MYISDVTPRADSAPPRAAPPAPQCAKEIVAHLQIERELGAGLQHRRQPERNENSSRTISRTMTSYDIKLLDRGFPRAYPAFRLARSGRTCVNRSNLCCARLRYAPKMP